MQICSWFKCIFMACAVLTQPASLTLDPWLIKAYKLLKVQQLAAAIGTRHLLSKVTTTTVFKWNVHSTGQPHPRPHPCLRALSAGGDHCRRLHHGHQSSATLQWITRRVRTVGDSKCSRVQKIQGKRAINKKWNSFSWLTLAMSTRLNGIVFMLANYAAFNVLDFIINLIIMGRGLNSAANQLELRFIKHLKYAMTRLTKMSRCVFARKCFRNSYWNCMEIMLHG